MRSIGMMPSHPGEFIHRQVREPLELGISKAAEILGVRRATLDVCRNWVWRD